MNFDINSLLNFDLGGLTNEFMKALGAVFALFYVPDKTGQGLLGFVDFFGTIGEFFMDLIAKLVGLFGGLGG